MVTNMQPWHFELQLNALSDAVVDVGERLLGAPLPHRPFDDGCEVDFPISRTRRIRDRR
jgi:hypothetical protein